MWKNIETGETYDNRKQAKLKLGHSNFNRAVKEQKIVLIKVYDACEVVI